MANKTIDMNKIRKVIKFHEEGKSKLFISNYLSLSRNTVKKYISTYQVLGANWEVLSKKTDEELEAIFITVPVPKPDERLKKLYAYFPKMERELKRVGATIHRAWEKYIAENPDGFKPTQFRTHYQKWSKKVNLVMHMEHKAGDKLFVDYAGKTLSYYDQELKETIEVQFFVAVLGASQFTYCEASRSQKKEDFIESLQNALHFFGGVPAAIVPDNLKSAVTKSNRFEPTINETLADFADHYQTTILPTRAYKPRDKSLVEGAVKILYMRIHNELKDTVFNDLESLNHAVWILLDKHNSKKLTQRPYSRLDLFDEDEKAHLKPLPLTRFEIKNQSFATVMQNGHVQLSEDKNYYSVPFQYIRKKVKLLYTKTDVEIYYKFNRIALHKRSLKPYSYTSNPEHLASEHLFVSEWSAARFIDWANSINEHVGNYIIEIIESRNHPEQAFKSCLGILSLEKKVGKERLVKACMRALDIQVYSYKTIQNILENNLENMSDESAESIDLPSHHNIRGKNYYN